MLSKKEVDAAIREKFRVKKRDIPPFTGWLKPSSRNDLWDLLGTLEQFEIGAEIGVQRGKNALQMLQRMPNIQKLFLVDPWIKYSNWTQDKMEARYQQTVDCLEPHLGATGNAEIVRKTSMEAVREFADEKLDFVYIDGFHDFDWVMPDIIFLAQKVRSGGIVAGHDYYQFYRAGITTAVDAYVKAHNITQWYITREMEPTWFWVK